MPNACDKVFKTYKRYIKKINVILCNMSAESLDALQK